jgi:hypothetical protein
VNGPRASADRRTRLAGRRSCPQEAKESLVVATGLTFDTGMLIALDLGEVLLTPCAEWSERPCEARPDQHLVADAANASLQLPVARGPRD